MKIDLAGRPTRAGPRDPRQQYARCVPRADHRRNLVVGQGQDGDSRPAQYALPSRARLRNTIGPSPRPTWLSCSVYTKGRALARALDDCQAIHVTAGRRSSWLVDRVYAIRIRAGQSPRGQSAHLQMYCRQSTSCLDRIRMMQNVTSASFKMSAEPGSLPGENTAGAERREGNIRAVMLHSVER